LNVWNVWKNASEEARLYARVSARDGSVKTMTEATATLALLTNGLGGAGLDQKTQLYWPSGVRKK
jgi:hypothetical protein